jgi:ribosomal subunit interface protein
MKLHVIGKNLDIGDSLRGHVEQKISEISTKYFSKPIEGKVVITKDAHLYVVDISVHAGRNILMQSEASAVDIYPAVDAAADKVEKQLRRHKRRLRDHHQRESVSSVAAQYAVIEGGRHDDDADKVEQADNGDPLIVAEMPTIIEDLTVSEAVMRLDLGNLPALMFRNRGHGGMNVIYRRPDGNIGWVDPQETVKKPDAPDNVVVKAIKSA